MANKNNGDIAGLLQLFVSHDLGVVAGIADKVLVMCEGTIREAGSTDSIFYNSQNDYTKKLLNAIPEGAKTLPSRLQPDNLVLSARFTVVGKMGF